MNLFSFRRFSWMMMASFLRSPLPPPDTKLLKNLLFFQKSSWQRSDNSICYWKFGTLYIVLISLQLLVILKLSKLFKGCDTKRLLKHRCLQIRVQAVIFKYSNLIKTKKNHQNEKPENFLYFWSDIVGRGKGKFLSFVFVSVLNETWEINLLWECWILSDRDIKYT